MLFILQVIAGHLIQHSHCNDLIIAWLTHDLGKMIQLTIMQN